MGTITHKKTSLQPDDPDTTLVRPSDWNDTHNFTLTMQDITGGLGMMYGIQLVTQGF